VTSLNFFKLYAAILLIYLAYTREPKNNFLHVDFLQMSSIMSNDKHYSTVHR